MIHQYGEYQIKPEMPDILKCQLDAGNREQAIVLKNYNEALELWEEQQKWPVFKVEYQFEIDGSREIKVRAPDKQSAKEYIQDMGFEELSEYVDDMEIRVLSVREEL